MLKFTSVSRMFSRSAIRSCVLVVVNSDMRYHCAVAAVCFPSSSNSHSSAKGRYPLTVTRFPLNINPTSFAVKKECITAVLAHSVDLEQIEPMLSWTFVFLVLLSLAKAGEDDHHVASGDGRVTL